METSKKILFFANTDWYLYNFRLALARAIKQRGYELVLVAPPGEYSQRLEQEGFRFVPLDFDRGSLGVSSNWRIYRAIKQIYRQEKPDLVHHFTVKCVLSGGIAARQLGIPAVDSVTGLGHVFTRNGFPMSMVRVGVTRIYRHVCEHELAHTIFQNEEDQQSLISSAGIDPERTSLIRGSGADCNRFRPAKILHDGCRILFASRLLREKGVFELLEAARLLRDRGIDFELWIAGETYPGNPSSLTPQDVERLKADAKYLGQVDDMPDLLNQVDLVVLPSHREGTPRILLEAGAAGKPLVATDIAGCRGVVQPGVNGELVPVGSSGDLANALEKLIVDPDLRAQYGRASHEIVNNSFSEESVVDRTLGVYGRFIEI